LALLCAASVFFFNARPVAGQQGPKVNTSPMGSWVASSEEAAKSASKSDPTGHERSWHYIVHASDTLDLTFTRTPEFNQTVTVQPDGCISLRDVGQVLAAGKTLAELTVSVMDAYRKTLLDPMISIDAKDFEKPYVLVGGQVGKPGKFDWRGELTLTQAIVIAGGFTDNAKHSQVLLFRRVSDEWAEAKLINVKQMLRAGNLQEDVILQPGDMVYVPKNSISKIKPYIPVPTLGLYSNQF
jgi:polysaccharide biosynthesis/export protein